MSETTAEIRKLARDVIEGGIVAQAAERLVYQIVEVCAEHEKTAVAAEREACAKLVDNPSTHLIAAAIRARGGTKDGTGQAVHKAKDDGK